MTSSSSYPAYHHRPTYGDPPVGARIMSPSSSNAAVSSPLDQIRAYTNKLEAVIERVSEPIKPYLPAFGRFLIVVTFLEDALRITTQFGQQISFLRLSRGIPAGIAHLFLVYNIAAMVAGSFLVMARKRTEIAVGLLFSVVVSQAFGYGMLFDSSFLFRNLSIIGGLLMLLSDTLHHRNSAFPGLPQMSDLSSQQRTYSQLLGRILLVCLFFGFIFRGTTGGSGWGPLRIAAVAIGSIACLMVVVGFKARLSAFVLVALLSVINLIVNNFWSMQAHPMQRDFLKYDFFQTLSIMCGLLLLISMGAGDFSIDRRKKLY